MAEDRLELRLDAEHRRKLLKIAEVRDATLSYTVRELIDEAYEGAELGERLRAVDMIRNAHAEEAMPDPDEMTRQIEGAYDVNLP
jgi:hypothetical protein